MSICVVCGECPYDCQCEEWAIENALRPLKKQLQAADALAKSVDNYHSYLCLGCEICKALAAYEKLRSQAQ